MSHADPCPCGASRSYAQCCGVYHRGEREAPTAGALMRSRYSAFAKRHAAYLWRTLHRDHPDRAQPEARGLASLRDAAERQRFLGLTVLDEQAPDGDGLARVLFVAKVFLKGRDLSFAECSDFEHDGLGWRYLSGVCVPLRDLREGTSGLTIARFLDAHAPR